jgi:hypothetical protein
MPPSEPPPRLTIELPAVPRAPATRSPPVATAGAAAVASIAGAAFWSGSPVLMVAGALGVAGAILALWLVEGLLGPPSRARRQRRRFDDRMRAATRTLHDLHRLELAELHGRFPGSAAVARAARAGTDAGSAAEMTRASSATPHLVLGRGAVASSVVPLPIRSGDERDGRSERAGRGGADADAAAECARFVSDASVLDDGPLCVEGRGVVAVVGPLPLARAAALGYRLQARRRHANGLDVRYTTDLDETSGVDVVIEIAVDATAVVTRRAGRACRVPIDLDYVSVRDVAAGGPA